MTSQSGVRWISSRSDLPYRPTCLPCRGLERKDYNIFKVLKYHKDLQRIACLISQLIVHCTDDIILGWLMAPGHIGGGGGVVMWMNVFDKRARVVKPCPTYMGCNL